MNEVNKNIVKVGKSDELASVIDKIVTSDAKMVFLVVDDNSYIAQNVLNLRLIKRESENVGKEVVMVSENPRIQNIAAKASLKVKERMDDDVVIPKAASPVFSATQASANNTDKRYTREVMDILPPKHSSPSSTGTTDLRSTRTTEAALPPQTQELAEEQKVQTKQETPVAAPVREPKEEDLPVKTYDPDIEQEIKKRKFKLPSVAPVLLPFRKLKNISSPSIFKKPLYILALVGGIVAVFGFIYLATNVLPKATIVLNPHTAEDEMNFAVVADSNISSADYTKSTVPAQILEERKEETFVYKATGSAQLEEFAIGRVRIYNEFSSSPQTLVANTRLMSSEGKLFRTTETIVVPGATIDGGKIIASSIEVGIRADEAGQDFNIAPTTFSIPGFRGDPKYLAFYGKTEESTTGGYKGIATVPTEEDIENAKRKINDEYLPALEQGLRNKVPDNLVFLEESLDARVDTLDIDAVAGEPKEEFTVRFVGVAQVFLIREEDVSNSIAHHFINSTKYSKDFELSEERGIEYTVKEADYEQGYTEFNLKVKQRFNRIVDAASVLEEVIGKDEAEVRRILSANEALQRAQVRFWPFWVKAVPENPESVEIEIEYIIEE